MAVRDIEAFLRERGQKYDPNIDTNPGSPFDVQVVQPTVRRLGTDPFTVDTSTFIATRMQQLYPDIANQEEDAVTDLLNKPATLLFDPMVREVQRVRQNLSFQDPTLMTVEEADALGANFFETRRRGSLTRGVGRILFAQPQNASVSPANFFTANGGLHFFPTQNQSISVQEMLLNITADNLYYFDINIIAEEAGTQYNIDKDELISVSNMPAAVRVTNTRRFSSGETEENAQQFISRVRQNLSEKSLVTLRGVSAKLVDSFPEINRLNVVGFSDPEMQRDIIKGGGLGDATFAGRDGVVVADGEGSNLQRRFFSSSADFITLAGGTGDVSGFVLTVFDAFGPSSIMQDLPVLRVLDANTIDVTEQVMVLGSSDLRWSLRKTELTLSDIPGGILFPNTANGELVIEDDEVHIGGMYDTYLRGSSFDEDVFTISNVTDDAPLLKGTDARLYDDAGTFKFELQSLVFDQDFTTNDATWQALDNAVRFGYAFQVQDPPEQGVYRILDWSLTPQVLPTDPQMVLLTVTPGPIGPVTAAEMRWRLFDEINVDLTNPRETKAEGSDLNTLQNSDVVTVGGGTDFNALGVAEGDVVEILGGESEGQYVITTDPLTPTSLQIDTVLSDTASGQSYTVYRKNDGALNPPFVRILNVDLLDSSGQPIGTTVPYAKPVDCQTRAFQNPARGVKHDFTDTLLGLVSLSGSTFNTTGLELVVYVEGAAIPEQSIFLTSNAAMPLTDVISELNSEMLSKFGVPEAVTQVGNSRFGFRPVGDGGFVAITGGAAKASLFGTDAVYTSGDIRSADVDNDGGWTALDPPIDFNEGLEVFQVLDGGDIGFYPAPFTARGDALLIGTFVDVYTVPAKCFSPAQNRRTQVGSRSIGSARTYFLAPTSFEIDQDSFFTLDTEDSGTVRFLPDPTLDYQQLPSLPSDVALQDGEVAESSNVFTAPSQDFILSGIQPGDKLIVDTMPIEGTAIITDPMPNLASKTLNFSLDGESDRVVIFLRDEASLNPGEVSKQGVVDQINAVAGETIVELSTTDTLKFTTYRTLVIRGVDALLNQGTANADILADVANTAPIQSFATVEDRNNTSPAEDTYTVSAVGQTTLTLTEAFPTSFSPYAAALTEQNFRVYRSGVQRISSTAMAENEADNQLYYFDVELVSEGAGDFWNVSAMQQLVPSGYRSDGYYLTTEDNNLTFSDVEKPSMVLSRSILEPGVDDDPNNATQLTGQNMEITYDRTQLVEDAQNFLSSETERVICANPLSRHLIPYFTRLDIIYNGGADEDTVVTDLEEYINDLSPVDTLDASDVQKIVTDLGANYVQNPLDMVAVVHNIDRVVWIERSQNQLAVDDRLSAFIPDVLSVQKEIT